MRSVDFKLAKCFCKKKFGALLSEIIQEKYDWGPSIKSLGYVFVGYTQFIDLYK